MRLSVSRKGLIVVVAPVIFYVVFLAALLVLQRQRDEDIRMELEIRELTRAPYQLSRLIVDAGIRNTRVRDHRRRGFHRAVPGGRARDSALTRQDGDEG